MLSVAALTGCTSKLKKENEALASEIAERREALKEHQQQSLKDAQRELAVTDSLLEDATRRYDGLHRLVMEHAATMNDASPEVVELLPVPTALPTPPNSPPRKPSALPMCLLRPNV